MKSVKCCFELKLGELNDGPRRGGGVCDDGLSVSRQSDRCGGRAKGACRGESAAVSKVLFPLAGCFRLLVPMLVPPSPGLAHLKSV